MSPQEFVTLYSKKDFDETVTPFENEAGFSLIRTYPKETPYYNDDRRIFFRIALLDRGLFYSVDMTKPEKRNEKTEYVVKDDGEYKKRVTNFFSDGGEFTFEGTNNRVVHTKTKKSFTLNEFIDILETNHLADRLFWKRALNFIDDLALKSLFWLSDKRYEKIRVSIDKYKFSRDNTSIVDEQKNIEPFFKYFYISKNFVFGTLFLIFGVAVFVATFPEIFPIKQIWNKLFGDFTLSNPVVVLLFS